MAIKTIGSKKKFQPTEPLVEDINDNFTEVYAAVALNTAKETNTLTNITVVEAPTNVDIQSSDGTNDTIAAADTTNAGVMTKAMYDEHVANNAKVTYNSTDSTKVGFISVTQAVDLDAIENGTGFSLTEYADNAAAVTGGLSVGDLYSTTGTVKIVTA